MGVQIGEQRYGLLMDEDWGTAPRIEAIKVRLRDVLKQPKTVIDYLYDFGDAWAHRLIVINIRPGEPGVSYPRYIGGEWAGPPTDCGGTPGFYDMLDAMADTEHLNHAEIMEWLDDYDPKKSTGSRSGSHSDALPTAQCRKIRLAKKDA